MSTERLQTVDRGVDKVDLEFQKAVSQGRFDPDGGRVQEELIDDRIFVE